MNATSLRRFWWISAPLRISRISPLLAAMLRDGRYLGAWPTVAAYAPAVALVIGLALGWLRPGGWTTYSFSITLMAVFLLLSGASAALGLWAWCGWVLGDFFLFSHPLGEATGLGLVWALVRVRVPLLISYALLLGLIAIPFTTTVLVRRHSVVGKDLTTRPSVENKTTDTGSSRVALIAIVAAILTFAWTLVVPILIRPVMWWPLPGRSSHRRIGQIAPVEAFAPLQHHGWMLAVVSLAAIGLRSLLERAARKIPMPAVLSLYGIAQLPRVVPGSQPASSSRSNNALSIARLLGGIALGTLLLSGLASNAREALVLAAFLLVDVLVGRSLASVSAWTRLLSRISFPLRLVLIAIASIVVSWLVLAARWDNMQTFLPIITSVGLSLFVSRAFLADRLKSRVR